MVGVAAGALVAAGLAVASASAAMGNARHHPAGPPARSFAELALDGGMGTFTPAAADPRLAAVFARAGLDNGSFEFTPAAARHGNRAVTVAVRARSNRVASPATEQERVASASAPSVGVAPIAYNLGAAVGWKRFAVSGDVAHVDLGEQPGSRESVGVGLSYSLKRFTGRVKAAADHALAGTSPLVEEAPSYSIDVGGSYSLTHNIDLTAGLRYKAERVERLQRLSDERRESQAVYLGTAFRF